MDLNQYNIQKLIRWSNIQPTKLEKQKRNVRTIFGAMAVLVSILTPAKVFFAGIAAVSFLGSFVDWAKYAKKRHYASRKLNDVVTELSRQGIFTNKLTLQKATTFSTHCHSEKINNPYKVGEAQTVVFEDVYGDLKALRQIRDEISRDASYLNCIHDMMRDSKCKSIGEQYTEIEKNPVKVKQLLGAKKR